MKDRIEKPILFSGPMVRAILEGRKTQTRRAVKKPGCQCGTWIPEEMGATTEEGFQTVGHSGRWWCECCTSDQDAITCPYGTPGDRLWVRESWNYGFVDSDGEAWPSGIWRPIPKEKLPGFYASYAADGEDGPWRPSIHMPRWMSRITLKITNVRVERLQDISESDAMAEGVDVSEYIECINPPYMEPCSSAKRAYSSLWESINGPGSWAQNPWVWCISFRRTA